jgi:hypothetical protein
MAANFNPSRLIRLLPVLAGSALIGVVFLVEVVAAEDIPLPLRLALLVSGCAFVVLGVGSRQRWLSAGLAKASLAILTTTLLLALAEVAFRVAGFDFQRLNDPGEDLPIYYRPPTFHAGDGIFRRPGPGSWEGRPIAAFMRIRWGSPGLYTNERPVRIEYDTLGFRNPSDLADWEVVVTGDSFVESGYLPYEKLFTTLAAQRLGLRIKNLGVSTTGPLSQTYYVQHYGKGASTKDAVLCFFEGNDLTDLSRELRNMESFRTNGYPVERPRQVSLVKALNEQMNRLSRPADGPAGIRINAVVLSGGQELPITVGGFPPVWERMGSKTREQVMRAMAGWAETTRSLGMRPWVMCLPDSHRVFHGNLRYADTNGTMAQWKPGEFAPQLGKACADLGVGFIDPFPALRREVEAGRVPYNLVGDNHLSVEGSRVVADVLADALRSGWGR